MWIPLIEGWGLTSGLADSDFVFAVAELDFEPQYFRGMKTILAALSGFDSDFAGFVDFAVAVAAFEKEIVGIEKKGFG